MTATTEKCKACGYDAFWMHTYYYAYDSGEGNVDVKFSCNKCGVTYNDPTKINIVKLVKDE